MLAAFPDLATVDTAPGTALFEAPRPQRTDIDREAATSAVIAMTSRDGKVAHLNPDLIESLEEGPDTHVVLINGKRLIAVEPCEELIERIAAWRRRVGTCTAAITYLTQDKT